MRTTARPKNASVQPPSARHIAARAVPLSTARDLSSPALRASRMFSKSLPTEPSPGLLPYFRQYTASCNPRKTTGTRRRGEKQAEIATTRLSPFTPGIAKAPRPETRATTPYRLATFFSNHRHAGGNHAAQTIARTRRLAGPCRWPPTWRQLAQPRHAARVPPLRRLYALSASRAAFAPAKRPDVYAKFRPQPPAG